jgi:ATP-dependent Clp protease ATP-binding subunit ClpC
VFERFTDRARRSVVLAQEEARLLNHNYIGTEHILLGLVREQDGVAAKALDSLNIKLDAVRREIEDVIGQGQAAPRGHIPFTPRAKKVLELSLREALQLGHNYIGTEHILLGLIREGEGVAAQVLQKLGADLNRVRQSVIQLLSGYAAGREVREVEGGAEMEELATEIAPTAIRAAEDAPMCPNCFGALDETLAVRVLETTAEGEPFSVRIVYCSRCGVALGVLP